MLVSPAPIVRHTSGGWPLHLVDLFPARPEDVSVRPTCAQLCELKLHNLELTQIIRPAQVTTAMLAAMRCFLHILQHATDRQGRPVSTCTHQACRMQHYIQSWHLDSCAPRECSPIDHVPVHQPEAARMQVIYVRIADIIKARMADHVPLPTRLAMHSANCELNKLLCVMASARAGYHIEELTQVGHYAVSFAGAQLHSRRGS